MNIYHLKFDAGRWILTREGAIEPVAEYTTKTEAELHSRELLKQCAGVLKIHSLDGSVDDERTIGLSDDLPAVVSPTSRASEIDSRPGEELMPGLRPYIFES